MGTWFPWFQIAVLLVSLAVPVLAFADAIRFDAHDYSAARTSRAGWLATILIGTVFLVGIGGWRPGTPLGLSGIIWLLTMSVVTVHFFEIRPRLVAARAQRRAVPAEIVRH